jgi:hypothetical protein
VRDNPENLHESLNIEYLGPFALKCLVRCVRYARMATLLAAEEEPTPES